MDKNMGDTIAFFRNIQGNFRIFPLPFGKDGATMIPKYLYLEGVCRP